VSDSLRKPYPLALQILAQFAEIVDLPVEDDPVAAVRRDHGLVAQGGEIQDTQAPVP